MWNVAHRKNSRTDGKKEGKAKNKHQNSITEYFYQQDRPPDKTKMIKKTQTNFSALLLQYY